MYNNCKKIWKTIEDAVGRNTTGKLPSLIEVDGVFITQKLDFVYDLNNLFINKIRLEIR